VIGAQTAHERSRGLPLACEVICLLLTGKGILTDSPSIAAVSAKGFEESAPPDMQRAGQLVGLRRLRGVPVTRA
jgi:hypothetical protein